MIRFWLANQAAVESSSPTSVRTRRTGRRQASTSQSGARKACQRSANYFREGQSERDRGAQALSSARHGARTQVRGAQSRALCRSAVVLGRDMTEAAVKKAALSRIIASYISRRMACSRARRSSSSRHAPSLRWSCLPPDAADGRGRRPAHRLRSCRLEARCRLGGAVGLQYRRWRGVRVPRPCRAWRERSSTPALAPCLYLTGQSIPMRSNDADEPHLRRDAQVQHGRQGGRFPPRHACAHQATTSALGPLIPPLGRPSSSSAREPTWRPLFRPAGAKRLARCAARRTIGRAKCSASNRTFHRPTGSTTLRAPVSSRPISTIGRRGEQARMTCSGFALSC